MEKKKPTMENILGEWLQMSYYRPIIHNQFERLLWTNFLAVWISLILTKANISEH